jgi:hypothetical protein
MRTHFALIATGHSVCGRGFRVTDRTPEVDCQLCLNSEQFEQANAAYLHAKDKAFWEQTPKPMREPWREGLMTCSKCSHQLFRDRDRSCYGHYSNHQCANCGHVESRLTETGMSF